LLPAGPPLPRCSSPADRELCPCQRGSIPILGMYVDPRGRACGPKPVGLPFPPSSFPPLGGHGGGGAGSSLTGPYLEGHQRRGTHVKRSRKAQCVWKDREPHSITNRSAPGGSCRRSPLSFGGVLACGSWGFEAQGMIAGGRGQATVKGGRRGRTQAPAHPPCGVSRAQFLGPLPWARPARQRKARPVRSGHARWDGPTPHPRTLLIRSS